MMNKPTGITQAVQPYPLSEYLTYNLINMKKIVLSIALLGLSGILLSQNENSAGNNSTHWKLSGNQATDNDFIGTVNEKPLIFKVDQIEHVRIEPETGVRFPQTEAVNVTNNSDYRVMVMTADGNIKMLAPGVLHDLVALDGKRDFTPIDVTDCQSTHNKTYTPEWHFLASEPNNGTPARIVAYESCEFTNVGINTSEPTSRLNVVSPANVDETAFSISKGTSGNDVFRVYNNGKVFASEVNIKLPQDYPDYVFKDDYVLISLEELDAYIKEHGHLPNAPQACEVEEEGLNVAEQQVMQMEKIEELTLYTIEQQKLIKQQREMIEVLQKRMEALELRVAGDE